MGGPDATEPAGHEWSQAGSVGTGTAVRSGGGRARTGAVSRGSGETEGLICSRWRADQFKVGADDAVALLDDDVPADEVGAQTPEPPEPCMPSRPPGPPRPSRPPVGDPMPTLSLIHISEPTRQAEISYAVFCLKKKQTTHQ